MSVADRISNLFSSNSSTSSSSSTFARPSLDISSGNGPTIKNTPAAKLAALEAEDESESRPPYLHSIVAGGIGGSTGDMLMHSLDTVKTRQQGAPNAIKYATMSDAYSTIFREEGFRRGLYGGVAPAFVGSLPGAMIFFGVYEYSKRHLINAGCPASLAYLTGGFLGDLCASVIYVPSEVLKTRLQLQGRYNNPHFKSGYNYRGTFDAARTIFRREGPAALFYGYKATLMRDLPFSALQFAFYEQFQKLAKSYSQSRDIGLHLEIITGAMAGGLAGVITCPLDVVKTRIQTQVRTSPPSSSTSTTSIPKRAVPRRSSSPTAHKRSLTTITPTHKPPLPLTPSCHLRREISTSSPSTPAPPIPGAMKFNTSSIFLGLKLLYQNEGLAGWFRGVGPRAVWTSVQSGTMLVLYQSLLKQMEKWENHEGDSL